MSDASALTRLFPFPTFAELDDDAILAGYATGAAHTDGRPWLRLNFVSSADGAVTHDGHSGGLGTPADHRVFDLLRRLADVILLGAGTLRIEGYGAMRVSETDAAWRAGRGLAPQPVFAIVSGSLDLDPASAVFSEAPVRPIVFATERSSAERRAALEAVADVVIAGAERAEPDVVLAELARRGLVRVHCEGGPTLAGILLAAGAVDELCLTLSPRLEGGGGPRLTGGVPAEPAGMRLAQLLHSADDTLLLRYVRARFPLVE